MAEGSLGAPLTGVYPLPEGDARLYERGMVVHGAGGGLVVQFAFMLGRPSIVTGDPTLTPPFGPEALPFELANLRFPRLDRLLAQALAGRLGLVPTGHPADRVLVTAGPVVLLKPEKRLDAGGLTIPAVYGVSVMPVALQPRQLYDVAVLADGGQWHIVGPHAVYHRERWTDFGLAHITDMHVARRIDRFRELLVRFGRTDAAQRLYNWNDRFRGFVRYANYLHDLGVLDVIIATGDLYDYIYENDDDPAGGGNAAFLRQLILGQAPGPDFPDVEELRVPLFLTPGNHDYRKHPYRLIFDVSVAGKTRRFRNFSGYNLSEADATVMTNGTELFVANISVKEAARMLEIDAAMTAYRTFLADPTSYVIQLGTHRIVMLDSAHDIGTVTEVLQALLVKLGAGSEDEETFVGGSPNCEGVSPKEFDTVATALGQVPDDGLFLVGLHAPLFNLWNTEYPYFLRETQRPVHAAQVLGFLGRHTGGLLPAHSPIEALMRDLHPEWFASDRAPHDAPAFVKRVDSQDLLDYGVSRGEAEALMRLLAGIGARRPADVVLAGHTHRYNEFRVHPLPTGELAYYMDFYTQNPAKYYPTRFTTGWRQITATGRPPTQPASVEPMTDMTYVEVVPDVAPDATPWPLPYDTTFTYFLQVPPYPTPLSAAPDPYAWWAAHRPLVLQTGALGPLESSQVSLSGFRVLSVKNNVIDRIHFVSIEKLEAHQYRLPWDDAIRPVLPRLYRHGERSRPFGAPTAEGAPAGLVVPARGISSVVYRDADGDLHEVWQQGATAGTRNLTQLAGHPLRATGNPTVYLDPTAGLEVALYRGTDGHVHSLYWSTDAVGHDALSRAAGAPQTVGMPTGYVSKDGVHYVIYRVRDGHLHALWWTGGERPAHRPLTVAGAPEAAGAPAAYSTTTTGDHIVVYRGNDGHIHTLSWLTGDVGHANRSAHAGTPRAVGNPLAYYTGHNATHQVTYRSSDNHLYELSWVGSTPAHGWDLTAAAGAPRAASDPTGYYHPATNTKHVLYRSADGHLHELWWRPSGRPTHIDLTLEALAPPAAEDKPTAFTITGAHSRHVVYRGTDSQIHEIRGPGLPLRPAIVPVIAAVLLEEETDPYTRPAIVPVIAALLLEEETRPVAPAVRL